VGIALTAIGAWPQDTLKAVTDNVSYNAGSEVRLKVFLSSSEHPRSTSFDISANLRYAGERELLEDRNVEIASHLNPGGKETATEYQTLWKIPEDARTGRYEVEVDLTDSQSHEALLVARRAASFSVYRKLVKIERIQLDRTFYTPADAVACKVDLRNLTDHTISNLRVEFSDRYWPWTAQTSERAGVDVQTIGEALSLPAGGEQHLQAAKAAVAKQVQHPSIQQYAVVVWDHDRKNIYDIAFSPEVFIQPSGVSEPKPYPLQYVYPSLDAVTVTSYRYFYPPGLDSAAIQIDRAHTMFPSGSEVSLRFSVRNPTDQPWHGGTIRARLRDSGGRELAAKQVAAGVNLDPRSSALAEETKFTLPTNQDGALRAQVEVDDTSGQALASGVLELAANRLPHSILIFCAHPDDEGAHAGIMRAAVENHIPIHVVYFTSGDAGSCDRYYEHSCAPAEALNFGALRMEEARRSLGHLGVSRENIYFLGLPDGGSGQIWYDHVEASSPYLSVLLASEHAPYEGVAEPNLPYARNAVVEAAKRFIREFDPEVIYTGHPDERHVDHRTNNWFVVKALQELLREGVVRPDLTLLTDQVYGPGPQAHAPYHYQKHVLHVSGDAMTLAQEAEWFYQSQSGNRELAHLRTFDQLRRVEVHWQILDWKDHEGWNEKR
jgi:LmbE family N-acetylglucosaminyl deacetylase